MGATATITLLPGGGGDASVEPGLHRRQHAPPPHPVWGAYRQRGDALGIPILAYDCVSEEAAGVAAHVVAQMLGGAEPGLVAALVEAGAEVALIGRRQVTTDLPMYCHLRGLDCGNGGGDYDAATRGLGGNPGSCAF